MKKETLSQGAKTLLIPAGLLVGVIIIFLIGVNTGLGQIEKKRSDLDLLRKNEKILTSKRDLLTSVAPDLASQTSLVSAVLPSENPALLVISQIKKLAVANEAYLSNIKVAVSGQTDSKTENAEISFDIKGQINSVLNLISEIKKVAPLIQVDSVKLSLDSDIAQATVQVRTYWAPYPTKMPALTEPTSGLSNSEQVLLVDLTDLELPDFDTNLVPTSPVENPNPFGE